MNSNSTFHIGHNHIICEDYALAGVSAGLAYAVVCDGCSASPEVDFGSRILAQSAKKAILSYRESDPMRFGEIIIQNAERIYDVLPHLHKQALDATVLTAWIEDSKVNARLYGDGVFVHKSGNNVYAVHIHLTSGAPDYLSYYLDSQRLALYKSMKDNVKPIETYEITNGTKTIISLAQAGPFTPVALKIDVKPGDIVALISDGINSFRKSDGAVIDWTDLIEEFVGFKNTEGEFAIRRIAAFKRKCAKEGITHYDDISIGAIIV
jgi:hypothetical protein